VEEGGSYITGRNDQIRKLAKLKDEGIISSQEFEAKKTELLRKL
jgi:putative oligomerization/nucleic acid binding protein